MLNLHKQTSAAKSVNQSLCHLKKTIAGVLTFSHAGEAQDFSRPVHLPGNYAEGFIIGGSAGWLIIGQTSRASTQCISLGLLKVNGCHIHLSVCYAIWSSHHVGSGGNKLTLFSSKQTCKAGTSFQGHLGPFCDLWRSCTTLRLWPRAVYSVLMGSWTLLCCRLHSLSWLQWLRPLWLRACHATTATTLLHAPNAVVWWRHSFIMKASSSLATLVSANSSATCAPIYPSGTWLRGPTTVFLVSHYGTAVVMTALLFCWVERVLDASVDPSACDRIPEEPSDLTIRQTLCPSKHRTRQMCAAWVSVQTVAK